MQPHLTGALLLSPINTSFIIVRDAKNTFSSENTLQEAGIPKNEKDTAIVVPSKNGKCRSLYWNYKSREATYYSKCTS